MTCLIDLLSAALFTHYAVPEGVLGASGVPAGEAAGEAPVQYNVTGQHQIRMRILKLCSAIFLVVRFRFSFLLILVPDCHSGTSQRSFDREIQRLNSKPLGGGGALMPIKL